MKKVLIVSNFFPPINVIAAKRYGIMCQYMQEYGYSPYVLTANPRNSSQFKLDLPCFLDESHIIRIGMIEDMTNYDSIKDVNNFLLRGIIGSLEKMKFYSRALNGDSVKWYEVVKKAFKEGKLDRVKDADIVIGTFPSMANIFIAHYISKKWKIPFVAELRDLISQYCEPIVGHRRAKWTDIILEKYYLNSAQAIIVVTNGFKEILKKNYKKPIGVVYNGWDNNITFTRISNKGLETRQSYLYYAGIFYPHRIESLEILIRSLKVVKETEKVKLVIRSAGPKVMDRQIMHLISQMGVKDIVELRNLGAQEIVNKEKAQASMNVVLSSIHEEDIALMMTIPGKVFELIAETKPILAVASPKSEIGHILDKTKKGIVSDNEKKIAEFILGGSLNYLGDEKQIGRFTRKYQTKRLCKYFDQLLNKN